MEKTFLMIKPDGVQRNLVGEIIGRVEKKGLKIIGLKFLQISDKLADKHYEEHIEKEFYSELKSFITSSPVVAMVLEGDNVVEVIHKMAGATNPKNSAYGTIRGDYAINFTKNVIHTSDSLESANREIKNFFKTEEIVNYVQSSQIWNG
ncbi:MAG: nucleoside-diphosphate kinase [Psychrilyobacter sp.]|nr:nucleoside-diphosphate kinase [Psychrilyobacter sp.]